MQSYRDLRVYQLAEEVEVQIYTITRSFPKSEIYSLTDQLLSAVHSILANIAEGFGRRIYPLEYIRFLTFSLGSCHESREHIKTAFSRNYCLRSDYERLDDQLDHIGRMLTLLIQRVRSNEKRIAN